jgi:hypothetical protein
MALRIKLDKEHREKNDYHRSVSFGIGSGGWSPLLPAWRNDMTLPASPPRGWEPVSEVYVKLTLDRLREIDGDKDLQSTFIRDQLKPEDGTLGLPILRLCLRKGQKLTDADIQYLCCLFPPPPYVTATAPFLFHYEEKQNELGKSVPNLRESALEPVDPDDYTKFVERFIARAGPSFSRELALCVPPNFTPSDIPRLLKAYRDYGAPLAIVDAFGSSTYDLYPVIRGLKGVGAKGKSYSLQELFGDHHAFYAFDSKPYVGLKGDVAASHLLQLDGGYSSFGPRHTVRTMIKKPPPGVRAPPPKPPRVMVPNAIAYCRADSSGDPTGPIQRWAARAAPGIKKPWMDSYLRNRFAAESVVRIAQSMSAWSTEGRLTAALDRRPLIAKELGRLRKTNRRLLDPTPSGRQTIL